MSNREKCIAILDSFDESQLVNIAAILQAAKNAIDEEDEAFCKSLYEDYQNDPDKGEGVTLEEAARQYQ